MFMRNLILILILLVLITVHLRTDGHSPTIDLTLKEALQGIDSTLLQGDYEDSIIVFPLLQQLNKQSKLSSVDSGNLKALYSYSKKFPKSPLLTQIFIKLGDIEKNTFQYEKALEHYNKALLKASKQNNKNTIYLINIKLATLYVDLQWYSCATEQCQKIISQGLSNINDSIVVYNKLAISLLNNRENYKSIETFLKVIEMNRSIGETIGIAASYNNIGVVFDNLERYDKAISYYNMAQKLYLNCSDSLEVSKTYNNIGVAYFQKGMLDSAELNFTLSLSIRELINDTKGLTSTYNNLGILMDEQGKYDNAEKYYNKSYSLKKALNDKYGIATYYLNIGNLDKSRKDNAKAIINLNKAFDIGKEYRFLEIIYSSAKTIGEIHSEQGNYQKAYQYSKIENAYYDSLHKQNQATEIAKMEHEHSLTDLKEEYEREYAMQMMQNEIKQHKQQRTITLLSAGFLFAIISIYFFIRQKRSIEQKNKILKESNQRIKESEQFIARSLNKTKALLDNSIVGIALLTPEGDIKQANKTLCKISGYSEAEIINKNIDIFYRDPQKRQEVLLLRDAAFKNRKTFEYEGILYDKYGNPKNIHISGRPIDFDIAKEIIWVIRDLSHLKKTEQQLNWFERFVECSNQGLAMAMLNGEVIYLNPYMQQLFGEVTTDKVIFSSYPASLQKKLHEEIIPQVLKEGKWEGELMQQTKNGELINTLEHFFVLTNDHGHPAFIADIITDITHLKKMEQELFNSNKAKDQLLSIIGHDLRSPVGTLDSMLQLLITNFNDISRERLQHILESLQVSTSETYSLLENLLFWAKGQQNELHVHPTVLDTQKTITSIRNLLMHTALHKNITITMEAEDNLFVRADEIMTSTIIRNIVTNAIKFTPEGGEIKIDTKELDNYIQFEITDTGIGIPVADIPHLFDEHEFYSTMGTRNEAGTGLGLILCGKFVKANNGQIWVKSEIDKGTTFVFTLPKA